MSEFMADVTVVGGGIAGLWTAKELTDAGLSVIVMEKSPELAAGATTRNEGWLHAGTYHAVAIYDPTDARNVTQRTIYGHNAVVDFAPEAIEHTTSFAFLGEDEIAHSSLHRWAELGVAHREVNPAQFSEEGFDANRITAAFAVKDKSVNSRELCGKLVRHIVERGGRIFTDADVHPVDAHTADVIIEGEEHTVVSGRFVVAAGAGTKTFFEKIDGTSLAMRYYKSHLLVTPRLTEHNYFYLDPLEAGIMSHGEVSIVGINREAMRLETPDCDVVPQTSQMVYEALVRMLPGAGGYRLESQDILSVACVKVDIAPDDMLQVDPRVICQDLNVKVFEPAPGYVCALPGKMTEAPYLARTVMDYLRKDLDIKPDQAGEQTGRPAVDIQIPRQVSRRPADAWMETWPVQLVS